MSDVITLRIEEKLLRDLDKAVKESNFPSRAGFVKDALRKAIDDWETKKAIKWLERTHGEGKRLGLKLPSPEEIEKIREEVGRRSLREAGLLKE